MTIASILMTLLLFALVGFVVWLLVTYIPMPEPFGKVIIVACVVLLVVYLIALLAGGAPVLDVPRVR